MTVHRHHKRALVVIALAAVLDVALGVPFGLCDHIGPWNGLYFAVSIATTAGNSPYYPHGWAAYTLALTMHLTLIPLWLAAFSLFTTGILAAHLERRDRGET